MSRNAGNGHFRDQNIKIVPLALIVPPSFESPGSATDQDSTRVKSSYAFISTQILHFINSWYRTQEYIHTVNDLLNAWGVYLIFVLKGGGRHLIETRRLLEGGIYFLFKVTHFNHRNKLTALLNSNSFHTTFANY